MHTLTPPLAFLLACITLAGCRDGANQPTPVDPAVIAAHQARFLLTEEPADVIGVLPLREKLLAEKAREENDGPDDGPVAIVGKIGGVPNPWKSAEPDYPWIEGKAKFFLSDLGVAKEAAKVAQTHVHQEGEACPFCAKNVRGDAVAVIRFMDEDGRQLAIDTRELFNLEGNETVVIRGNPVVRGEGKNAWLVIDATGLYVWAESEEVSNE